MSELNKIYEITQQLSSPQNLKNDLSEIADMISKHFSSKYLSPISAAMVSNKQYYSSHPSKEINLLKALKPFLSGTTDIDSIIDVVNTMRLFSDITSQELEEKTIVSAASIEDSAIHSDGIYEIDNACVNARIEKAESKNSAELNPIIILLLLIIIK